MQIIRRETLQESKRILSTNTHQPTRKLRGEAGRRTHSCNQMRLRLTSGEICRLCIWPHSGAADHTPVVVSVVSCFRPRDSGPHIVIGPIYQIGGLVLRASPQGWSVSVHSSVGSFCVPEVIIPCSRGSSNRNECIMPEHCSTSSSPHAQVQGKLAKVTSFNGENVV